MKTLFTYCLAIFLSFLLCSSQNVTSNELKSPDKILVAKIQLNPDGILTYQLSKGKKVIVNPSRLGYNLENNSIPAKGWSISESIPFSKDTIWNPLWGKRSVVLDKYNQLTLVLKNNESPSSIKELKVEMRLYNDGFAFRYIIPEGEEKAKKELTEFNFSSDPTCWFYNGENANYGPILLSQVNEIRPSNVTMQFANNTFLNIHEAYLQIGDPLRFSSSLNEQTLTVASSPGEFGVLKSGFVSPWRTIMIGEKPGDLADSHLLELLNPDPSGDFSWVKPGVALWDWRIDGAVWDGFKYTMSYPSWTRMIDFAAEEGFKYLVLDANWYGPEFENNSDPTTGDKAKDVQRLLAYGKEKGVGVWLYLNDVGGRKYPIEETLKQYGEWGAAGVKYGFMKGSPEEKNLWTQKITALCAENHLLVDFHDGPVHPFGQLRTWPNAVTREFCHAQLDGHHVFTPTTFCTTVFVNNIAGPVDMNNGMFDLRQGKTTRVDESQPVPSTLVSEAARTLIVFSGVTIIPDIPEYYKKYPPLLEFLAAQKMPWKESRTLAGEIGQYVMTMRQTENAWLIGAATNEEARALDIPMNFLSKGKYDVTIIEDGEGAHYLNNRETMKVTHKVVTPKDKILVHLAPGGGSCLIIKKN